jgi:hypothetical protein
MWTKILPHFGIATTASDCATMRDVARRDAKARHLEFSADSQSKQQAATEATRAAAARWLGEIHAELEALRGAAARTSRSPTQDSRW